MTRVAILLVSYNAALAVRVTLASLRQAENAVEHTLLLVDNASNHEDREAIRAAVEHHRGDGMPWQFLQEERNLGFAGGNNVGIRAALADPAVTHVCLLNSDVIVTDGWLDRLVAADVDLISPVTNKADGEQSVPVDYDLALADCLLPAGEHLRPEAFAAVNEYARRRADAFPGHVVVADPTFFCVLLTRRAIATIGLLDERFFPGGYEDNDYCLRAAAVGIRGHLHRGVYLHHWGSASFGQLDPGQFSRQSLQNKERFEQKHGLTLRHRAERPIVSFEHDAVFAASGRGEAALQRAMLVGFEAPIAGLLTHFRAECERLGKGTGANGQGLSPDLAKRLAAVVSEPEQGAVWNRLHARGLAAIGSRDVDVATRLRGELQRLADSAHEVIDCVFVLHAMRNPQPAHDGAAAPAPPPPPMAPSPSLLRRAYNGVRHGVPFFLGLRGIVFLGGYPYPARDHDGYFQRVRAIDRLVEDRWRIYFDPTPLPGTVTWHDRPAPRTLVLRPIGGRWRTRLVVLLVWLCALRCRTIWLHSVLRMHDFGMHRLLRLPFLRRILDVHGVVPEEYRMHDDFHNAARFEGHEAAAVRKARGVIVVTEAMRQYFAQKYQGRHPGEIVVLPIFPSVPSWTQPKPMPAGKPVVVYAGGLHKWQQVAKMMAAIEATHERCHHRFYCTDPDAALAMLSPAVRAAGTVLVERKAHGDLLLAYRECHYGFVLRTDSIVNRVACPTKIVEYLAMGIVPIVDSELIGDFRDLGMQFVRFEDFLAGRLPSPAEREAMAQANFAVHGRLREQREAGAVRVRQLLGPGMPTDGLPTRLAWQIGRHLPPETRRGRWARRLWYGLRGKAVPLPPAPVAAPAPPEPSAPPAESPPPCDVLVQVENFTAGGLENVVLDLNQVLCQQGLRVAMLVLGEQGPAVGRARAQGISVTVAPYSDGHYRHWLAAARPRIVISHYAPQGAALCAAASVPLLQVIHNVYVWLHGEALATMQRSAAHTTLFVAVSDYVRDYSIQRLGIAPSSCVVIPNGIDTDRLRLADRAGERIRLRNELGIEPETFVFLNVGSVNHQKNHLSQLRAFHAAASSCPGAMLVILGPVHEPQVHRECLEFVERHGLGDRVRFVGGVSDAHRYYAMADAMVHTAFFEGGQLSLLEGLAADLPIVTVNVGFARHFLGRDGVRIVPPHFDVAAYRGSLTTMPASAATERAAAQAMVEVWRDRRRPQLPRSIIDGFDRRNAYAAYVTLIQRLLAGDRELRNSVGRAWPLQLEATA